MSFLNEEVDRQYELLNRATLADCKLEQTAATMIIGLGTSGSKAVLELFRHLRQSKQGVPKGLIFIVVDVDQDGRKQSSLDEMTEVIFIPLGIYGAGTNTENGRRILEENYLEIKSTVVRAMVSLMEQEGHGVQFNVPPAQLLVAFILAGCGGTSGAADDVMATALYDAKRSVGLKKLEVNRWRIGPELPVHDVTREVSQDARERLPANSADNREACYVEMATKRYKTEFPPVGDPFVVQMSTRTYTNVEFDSTSRGHRLQTMDDLIQVISRCLYVQVFTAAGKEASSRHIDDLILGTTGQAFRATGSPVSER